MTLLCDLLPLRVGQEYLVAVMARLAHVRLVKGAFLGLLLSDFSTLFVQMR